MSVSDVESYFGNPLPRAYREFILDHPEGVSGDVHLYSLELLIERNECYETKQYAPGYINIGDDGGGQAILIRFDEDDPEVITVGHGSMDPKLKELVHPTFSSWVALGFQYHDE